jgi:cobalamin biosynthesis protein CobD/CbiB
MIKDLVTESIKQLPKRLLPNIVCLVCTSSYFFNILFFLKNNWFTHSPIYLVISFTFMMSLSWIVGFLVSGDFSGEKDSEGYFIWIYYVSILYLVPLSIISILFKFNFIIFFCLCFLVIIIRFIVNLFKRVNRKGTKNHVP